MRFDLVQATAVLGLSVPVVGIPPVIAAGGQELEGEPIEHRYMIEMTDEMEHKLREKYQLVIDALGKSQWMVAVKKANRLVHDLRDSRADSTPGFAARVLVLRAIAHAALGNQADALWDYDVAIALLPEIKQMELAVFPPASGALEALVLEREPCRSAPDLWRYPPSNGEDDRELLPRAPEGRVKTRMKPEYPWGMRALHISDTVLVDICVDRYGKPTEPRLITLMPVPFMLAAFESLALWRYKPATADGQPVPTKYMSEFHFDITWDGKGATAVR